MLRSAALVALTIELFAHGHAQGFTCSGRKQLHEELCVGKTTSSEACYSNKLGFRELGSEDYDSCCDQTNFNGDTTVTTTRDSLELDTRNFPFNNVDFVEAFMSLVGMDEILDEVTARRAESQTDALRRSTHIEGSHKDGMIVVLRDDDHAANTRTDQRYYVPAAAERHTAVFKFLPQSQGRLWSPPSERLYEDFDTPAKRAAAFELKLLSNGWTKRSVRNLGFTTNRFVWFDPDGTQLKGIGFAGSSTEKESFNAVARDLLAERLRLLDVDVPALQDNEDSESRPSNVPDDNGLVYTKKEESSDGTSFAEASDNSAAYTQTSTYIAAKTAFDSAPTDIQTAKDPAKVMNDALYDAKAAMTLAFADKVHTYDL